MQEEEKKSRMRKKMRCNFEKIWESKKRWSVVCEQEKEIGVVRDWSIV